MHLGRLGEIAVRRRRGRLPLQGRRLPGIVGARRLPAAKAGDYLVIHDAGAYGAAMSSNYNTRRLAAEVLVHEGQAEVIRERQTFEHILAFEKVPTHLA